MKAIIFYCIDNFNKQYQWVAICEESEIKSALAHYLENTEITDYEIVNVSRYNNTQPCEINGFEF